MGLLAVNPPTGSPAYPPTHLPACLPTPPPPASTHHPLCHPHASTLRLHNNYQVLLNGNVTDLSTVRLGDAKS